MSRAYRRRAPIKQAIERKNILFLLGTIALYCCRQSFRQLIQGDLQGKTCEGDSPRYLFQCSGVQSTGSSDHIIMVTYLSQAGSQPDQQDWGLW